MVVEHTDKSKYLSDKLTLSQYVGQQPYKLMLALWWKQIILISIQKFYFTIFKALRPVLSEYLTTEILDYIYYLIWYDQ